MIYYKQIPGMMDYEDLYSEMVNKFPTGSHFVEIGVWKGRSGMYMATEILKSGKKIRLTLIDNFMKSNRAEVSRLFKDIEFVNVICGGSWQSAHTYKDESFDFVFIDAEHSPEMVTRDIKAWLPKVKKRGILAGHDYGNERYPELKGAVDKLLDVKKVSKMCWMHEKP